MDISFNVVSLEDNSMTANDDLSKVKQNPVEKCRTR